MRKTPKKTHGGGPKTAITCNPYISLVTSVITDSITGYFNWHS